MKRRHGDKTVPFRTVTMIGCAFAIDREFFFEVGSYDEGLDIWGSENMEMSLRVSKRRARVTRIDAIKFLFSRQKIGLAMRRCDGDNTVLAHHTSFPNIDIFIRRRQTIDKKPK